MNDFGFGLKTLKIAKKAVFILFHRKRPQFILSYRYLNARHDRYIQFHRKLFLASVRKPGHMLLEMIAWVRWTGIEVWKVGYLTARNVSQETLQRYQLTRIAFFYQLIQYGLLHQLSPAQYIRYQFYKPGARRFIYHHVFDHQLPWFHHHINRKVADFSRSTKWIADKVVFSRALQAIGIATVVGEIYTATSLKKDTSVLFQRKSVFCKPPRGSQSMDCFLIYYHEKEDAHTLEPIHGPVLTDEKEIQVFLHQVFSRQTELVIQDYLVSHPSLGDQDKATTTVRIITGRCTPGDCPTLLYLQLEIAKDKKTIGKKIDQQCYDIIPLHVNTLEKDPVFMQRCTRNPPSDFVTPEPCKAMLRSAISMCLDAHVQLLPLMSVAFDVILGPEGPMMIEANYNWAVSVLYQVLPSETLNESDHPAACWLRAMMG